MRGGWMLMSALCSTVGSRRRTPRPRAVFLPVRRRNTGEWRNRLQHSWKPRSLSIQLGRCGFTYWIRVLRLTEAGFARWMEPVLLEKLPRRGTQPSTNCLLPIWMDITKTLEKNFLGEAPWSASVGRSTTLLAPRPRRSSVAFSGVILARGGGGREHWWRRRRRYKQSRSYRRSLRGDSKCDFRHDH